nr:hypothetical protein [Maliibacterium massiliense]
MQTWIVAIAGIAALLLQARCHRGERARLRGDALPPADGRRARSIPNIIRVRTRQAPPYEKE